MKMMTSGGLEIEARPVTPADEGQIVELFNRVFANRRFAAFTEEEWRWKYLRNPVARPELSFVAVDPRGKIIAHYGNWPFKVHSLGRQEMMSQYVDAMMLPEYQKHGILLSLFKPYCDALKQAGVKFTVVLPNEKSIHASRSTNRFMFFMDQRELLIGGDGHQAMLKWYQELDHDNRWGFDLKPDCELSESVDQMLAECRKRELLALWKDAAWYKWKYLESPRRTSYRFFSLDGMVCGGFAVVRELGDTADILEIHGMKKDVSYAKELILRLAEYYKDLNGPVRRLKFIGKDHWFFDGVFENFSRNHSFDYSLFVRSTYPEDAFLYENAASWTITHSDADEV